MARPRGTLAGGLIASFALAAALGLTPGALVLFGLAGTVFTVPAAHLLLEEAHDRGDVRRRCLAALAGAVLVTFALGRLVAVVLPVPGDPARLLLQCVALLCGVVVGGLVVAGGYDRVID